MDESKVENKPLYYTVTIFHALLCIYTLTGWLWYNKYNLKFLLAVQIIVILLFVVCKGCILTKLERKLNGKQNYSILDPMLDWIGVDPKKYRTPIFLTALLISVGITIYRLNYFYRTHRN